MFHTYIDWRHWFRYRVWPWMVRGAAVGFVVLALLRIFGCAAQQYPVTPVPVPEAVEFNDPLAIGRKQKESVALIVSRLGDPAIPFSWAGDDFKVKVLKWEIPNSNLERWAIRINDAYRFTWTQWKEEKK